MTDFSTYKLTYPALIKDYRIPDRWKDSKLMEDIFNCLNEDEALIWAVIQSKMGKPALKANYAKVDELIEESSEVNPDNYAEFNTFKQTVGIVQKAVLRPFGFFPINRKQKRLKKSKFFSSATCFELDESVNAPLKVCFDIEVQN